MKIKGLKKAVGDYKRANRDEPYSSTYGVLMFDKEDGQLWTDEFVSIGHNSWKEYESDGIINLSSLMNSRGIEINMTNVKAFIKENFEWYKEV